MYEKEMAIFQMYGIFVHSGSLFYFIQFYSVAHRVLRFYRKILIFTPLLTSHLSSIDAEFLRNRNKIHNFIVFLRKAFNRAKSP